MGTDIEFEPGADADLDEAIDFLGASSSGARRLAAAIDAVIQRLLEFPESAPVRRGGKRVAYVPDTRYSIVYEYEGGRIKVLAFTHTSRRPSRRRRS